MARVALRSLGNANFGVMLKPISSSGCANVPVGICSDDVPTRTSALPSKKRSLLQLRVQYQTDALLIATHYTSVFISETKYGLSQALQFTEVSGSNFVGLSEASLTKSLGEAANDIQYAIQLERKAA